MNEKLAEWAGFRLVSNVPVPYYQNPNRQAVTRSGDMPNFTQSLDACFEWLVPKLRREGEYPYLNEIIIDPTMCDEEMYYCYLRYDSLHDDGCIEREESQGSAITPSLAFCNAVIGMIK